MLRLFLKKLVKEGLAVLVAWQVTFPLSLEPLHF